MPSHDPTARGPGAKSAECHGRVVAIDNGQVTVELAGPSECASCVSKGHCHLAPETNRQVKLAATGFKPGDQVRVLADSKDVLRASCVLYAFPTLFILLGAFAGYFAGPEFLNVTQDIGSTLGVALGIGLSWLFIHLYQGRRAAPVVRLERIE